MEFRHEIIHFEDDFPAKLFLHRLGSVSKHWHRSLELLFVASGTVNVIIDDRSVVLNAEDVLLINSLSTHELFAEDASLVAVQIDLMGLPQFAPYRSMYFDCCSAGRENLPSFDYIRHLIARMIKVNTDSENPMLSLAMLSFLMDSLVNNFRSEIPESIRMRQKSIRQMNRIIEYLQENYAGNIGLNEAAEHFHFSASYLSRLFKKQLNITFSDYYNSIRLDHAVNDMLTTNDSIAAISERNGFPDARSFTAIFRKRYSMLPSEYRTSHSTLVPEDVSKNEINYLEARGSEQLTVLAKYLDYAIARRFTPETGAQEKQLSLPSLDVREQGSPLEHTWRTLCTVGSTRDLLSEDVREMLRREQREMPFRYVKFHGLLSDDLALYSEDKDGNPVFSFVYFDKVMDFLKEVGLKPLMQFCFMPSALASDPGKTSFYIKQNTSLPKDLDKWTVLVEAVVRHVIMRYGLAEVKTWLFSLWNEPDTTPQMFGFEDRQGFFRLYARTFRTVKAICPDFRFGTPGLLLLPEDPLGWYRAFFDFCKAENCTPDFINLHYYDDDIELETSGLKKTRIINKLSSDPDSFGKFLSQVYENMPSYHVKGKPMYLTEWNLTVSHRNMINDTCFKSCYLIRNILENYDRIRSFGYWFLTDLAGEMQLPDRIFHGGLGFFTVNQIPKAHYQAMRLLTHLKDRKLGAGNGWFLTKDPDTGALALILYNYAHYNRLFSEGEMFDMTDTNRYSVFSDLKPMQITLPLEGLENGFYHITKSFVNQEEGSSYDAWIQMGAPQYLSEDDIMYIRKRSSPGRRIENPEVTDGTLLISETLKPLEVRLIEIERIHS